MLAAPQCDSPLQSGADILRICASAVDKEKRSEEDGGVDGGDVRVRSKEVRLLACLVHAFPPSSAQWTSSTKETGLLAHLVTFLQVHSSFLLPSLVHRRMQKMHRMGCLSPSVSSP